MSYPLKARLVEVGPRDGLQNEAKPVSVEDKVGLIDALTAAGHSAVEAGRPGLGSRLFNCSVATANSAAPPSARAANGSARSKP